MAAEQTRYFLVPSAESGRVIAAVRASYPNALIGTKPYQSDTVLMAVTLYSADPEGVEELVSSLGADTLAVPSVAPPKPLSELVAEIQRLTQPGPERSDHP